MSFQSVTLAAAAPDQLQRSPAALLRAQTLETIGRLAAGVGREAAP